MARLLTLGMNRTDYEAAVKNKLPVFKNFIFLGNATTLAQTPIFRVTSKNHT